MKMFLSAIQHLSPDPGVRPHLTLHFEKLLQKKNAAKGANSRKRVKPKYYRESLTSEEVFERLEADKESHKRPSKKRRQSQRPASNEREVESHDEDIIYRGIENLSSPVIFLIYKSALTFYVRFLYSIVFFM